jgi:hypothetical protein
MKTESQFYTTPYFLIIMELGQFSMTSIKLITTLRSKSFKVTLCEFCNNTFFNLLGNFRQTGGLV